MEAVILRTYGKDSSVLATETVSRGALGSRQVRVRTGAFAINPVDVKVQRGEPRMILPLRPPFVPGCDMAGTVEAIGTEVTDFVVGDRVYGYLGMDRMGAFARAVDVDSSRVSRTPAGITDLEAATLPLPALCALQSLRAAGVTQGSHLLVLGASGAVGRAAVQIAVHTGAEVSATASELHHETVLADGASRVIDHQDAERLGAPRGVDAVIDTVGGDVFARTSRLLRRGGTLVSLHAPPKPDDLRAAGLHAGLVVRTVLPLAAMGARRRADKAGVTLVPMLTSPSASDLAEVTRLVDSGGLRPAKVVAYPFAGYRDAYAAMAERVDRRRNGRSSVGDGRVVIRCD